MKQRFCPVCDTKLGTSRICPVCKKWVRDPVYMDGDFYLNESHPADERDCEYHAIINGHKAYEEQPEKKRIRKPAPKGMQPAAGSYAAREKEEYKKTKEKKSAGAVIFLFIAIYIMYQFISVLAAGWDQIAPAVEQILK